MVWSTKRLLLLLADLPDSETCKALTERNRAVPSCLGWFCLGLLFPCRKKCCRMGWDGRGHSAPLPGACASANGLALTQPTPHCLALGEGGFGGVPLFCYVVSGKLQHKVSPQRGRASPAWEDASECTASCVPRARCLGRGRPLQNAGQASSFALGADCALGTGTHSWKEMR